MGINEHLIDLLEYVEEMARMAERAVFSIHSYRTLAVLEHQLHNRVGIQHDTGDNDGPVWLRIERLQRFDPPIADDAIKDWLVISRDPSSPPKVLTTRLVQMPRTDADKLLAERRIDAPDIMPPSRSRGEDVVDVRLRLDRWPDRQRAVEEYVAGQAQARCLVRPVQTAAVHGPDRATGNLVIQACSP
jgi:hypothetical protein